MKQQQGIEIPYVDVEENIGKTTEEDIEILQEDMNNAVSDSKAHLEQETYVILTQKRIVLGRKNSDDEAVI